MTKEELEKKREDLSYSYDPKHKCDGYGCCHSDSEDQKTFKAGFDSAVNLLLPRLEALEEAVRCLKILEKAITDHSTVCIEVNNGAHKAIKNALEMLKDKKNE